MLTRFCFALALLVPVVACSEANESAARRSAAPAQGSAPVASATTTAASAGTATAAPSASAEAEPPKRIAAQHVLIGFKGTKVGTATRSKAEAKKLADEVHKKAIEGADFAKLAEQYSDDPASKDRLGSVGTFDREGMVKPFSDAAFALKVNEISPVVETYFGFHIIKPPTSRRRTPREEGAPRPRVSSGICLGSLSLSWWVCSPSRRRAVGSP